MFGFGTRTVNVTTQELQEKIKRGEKLTVIDVREPWEYAEGHLPGSVLRPVGQIRTWANDYDKEAELYLICRTASRSAVAAKFLQSLGFKNVRNVSGGIISWRGQVAR
ncbi:MAG TPA: rhodanese-like domain-containing protein [Symbiobacteriaceae bacterium]|nr:rhodanese-like domain-containing protein [Symbiobacteriaceae bacterium]